jgi:hypothetical protein
MCNKYIQTTNEMLIQIDLLLMASYNIINVI